MVGLDRSLDAGYMEREMESSCGRDGEEEEEVTRPAGGGDGGETGSEGDGGIKDLHSALTQVTDKMKGNIVAVLERGENLSDLSRMSSDVERSAMRFQRKAEKVKASSKKTNKKMVAAIVIVVLFVLLIIIIIISLLATGVVPMGKTDP